MHTIYTYKRLDIYTYERITLNEGKKISKSVTVIIFYAPLSYRYTILLAIYYRNIQYYNVLFT